MIMIIDEAFFGFARAGTMGGNTPYPCILDTTDPEQLKLTDGSLEILGQKARPFREKDTDEPADFRNPVEWLSEDIVIIPDGAQLIQRPRELIEKLSYIRNKHGMSKLIYLQGIADPYLIPILVYAGVSIFDDSTIRMESIKGIKYTIFGRSKADSAEITDNIDFIRELIKAVSRSIRSGSIREIVEKYQISSKALEIMRLLDKDYEEECEKFFPRRTPYIKANSLESLRRPDLTRYREYVSNQYKKPSGKNVAVLMPCSARKPYSTSKSHKRIIEAIGKMRNQVHELIVTSPVGLVPRELEQTYPASSYDIPVIGEWYDDEKSMISNIIGAFFKNNSYDKVVAFVDKDLEFIMDSLPEGSILVSWDRSDESLSRLRETVSSIISEHPSSVKTNYKMERYTKIAEYQFGEWIAKYLEGCKIVRNYNSEMVVKDGKPVLIFNETLGKFTINKQSAPWFIENGKFLVEIDDFKPTANIYAVGVLSTTPDVRQEDEVVLHHKGELKGVGIAKMPSRAMIDLKKGVAVKVRN